MKKKSSASSRLSKSLNKDFQSLMEENTVQLASKDPFDIIKEVFDTLTPMSQNILLKDITNEIASRRLREANDAKIKHENAEHIAADFENKFPGVVNYKRGI